MSWLTKIFNLPTVDPGRYGFLVGPAAFEAVFDHPWGDAREPCPLSQRFRYAFYCEAYIITFVISLCARVSPVTVARAISSVVVVSFYRVVRCGLFTHVVKKILKGVTPVSTNGDTSGTIDTKFNVVPVVTPSIHPGPAFILRGSCFAVNIVPGDSYLGVQASAGGRVPGSEIAPVDDSFCATIANRVPPEQLIARQFNPERYNYEPSETLSCKIDKRTHWLTLSKLMSRWSGASNTRSTDYSSMWGA